MPPLYRVLYCSRSAVPGPPHVLVGQLRGILAISRQNNLRDELTGGLLFSDGCFAQVLEGPLDVVERTFERIQCDARHVEVTVLQAETIVRRDFAAWSMALCGADAAHPIFGIDFPNAFAGRSNAGEALFRVLKDAVAHQANWITPSPDPAAPYWQGACPAP